MVNILILTAFPRCDGFTRYCTDFFIKGVARTGVSHTIINLVKSDIKPCKGCFHCWCTTPGRCIQNDDMYKLLELFLDSDALVCATPLYAYNISSPLKVFFERTLPLLSPGVTDTPTGIDRNMVRYPERGPRTMAAIVVGGLGARTHADGAVTSLRLFAEGFNMRFAGALVRNESYLLQFTDTKPKTIKTIETAIEQAGRTFALDGTIDRELIEKAAAPLAVDRAHFQMYSNIYWEHARRVFARGGTIDEVRLLTKGDIHILMEEMALAVDPATTANVRAAVQFIFTDTGSTYHLIIDDGTARCEQAEKSPCDLKITCPETVWTGILHRTADPVRALANGEIKLEGDRELFRKFGRFFPPPNI